MKYDMATRRVIVGALNYLTANSEPDKAECDAAIALLNHALRNAEDWRPENWTKKETV
jgi:hypothetical protein